MINLPKISKQKNKNYFCTGDDNHILIFESNKIPRNQKKDNENEGKKEDKDESLRFTLIKDIELNTLTHCIIEINEQYIAAACTKAKSIIIFDAKNNFNKVAEIKDVSSSFGSNIMALMPNEDILIVACSNGFNLISTKKFKKYKAVNCRYSVLSLDLINDNTIICCCSEEKNNKIKQYNISDIDYNFKKLSERKIFNNDEIWKLKIINERIFYLDSKSILCYLK